MSWSLKLAAKGAITTLVRAPDLKSFSSLYVTAANCPARFGELASLTPCGPWQIAQRCASVAPRPIETASFRVNISEVITTLEVLKSGCNDGAGTDTRGTPAALQIASQMPLSLRSGCASGSQIKPASAASTAMQAVTPTLALTQGLRNEDSGCSLIGLLRHRPRAHWSAAAPSTARSDSR